MRRTRQVIPVAVALVVVSAAVAAWAFWLNRGVLTGRLEHDFGLVRFDRPGHRMEHVFLLRNRTDETLVIEAIRPSCTCASAESSQRIVMPQGELKLQATMRLTATGAKRASITLLFAEHRPMTLKLEAFGRLEPALFAVQDIPEVQLVRDRPASLEVALLIYTDNEEPLPAFVDAPMDVEAHFGGWRQAQPFDRARGQPARWHGTVTLMTSAASLPDDAMLEVYGVGGELFVPLTLRADDDER